MRVISGSARGTKLLAPEGILTRPTTDRIKETLFNMIFTNIFGSEVIDLYSGSGAIGIEALSRGAKHCIFVENDRKACGILKENLRKTRLIDKATIYQKNVDEVLKNLTHSFDFIFMDPPYELGEEGKILNIISQKGLLRSNGIVIVEGKASRSIDHLEPLSLEVYKEKNYGNCKHIFIRQLGHT